MRGKVANFAHEGRQLLPKVANFAHEGRQLFAKVANCARKVAKTIHTKLATLATFGKTRGF
jgi:hypothetical protein